jgi:hypothetical protein
MRKILIAVLLVLAMVVPAFAQHDEPSEMVIKELDAGDVGILAEVAPKTRIYGTWGWNVNADGSYWFTYKFLNTSDYSCCTRFYTYFGIAKAGNYTIKVLMLEKNASGAWVPASEAWPGFVDPMKWVEKQAPYSPGYYNTYHHVHFLNPGLKQYKVQIITPSDGAILAQNTTFFDVY